MWARAWGCLVRVACVLVWLLPAAAMAQEYPNCPHQVWATGSRLGWAEALARDGHQGMDDALFTHLRAAGAHARQANADCAPSPPAWPNWQGLQSSIEQTIDAYRRGLINRGQLAAYITNLQSTLAGELARRVFDAQVVPDRTCAQMYVLSGSALAFAQTSTQIHRALTPMATDRLQRARSAIVQMQQLRPPCRNLSGLLPFIDDALRHPADDSTVLRLNDLWQAGASATRPGEPPVAPPVSPVTGEITNCWFHLWATGSRLGWAEALARSGNTGSDALMFTHMAVAGLHVERAHAICAQSPPPWPAWQNWREVQAQIQQLADQYRRGLINRAQLATGLAGLANALAGQLAYQYQGDRVERAHTCAELYLLIGDALGFAQTTTQMNGHLTPEAAAHLREARQWIVLGAQLRPPCHNLNSLLPMIDQALGQPGNPNAVNWVNQAWSGAAIILAPADPQPAPLAPLTPPQPIPVPPVVPPQAQTLSFTGGLDPATVQRHVNHIVRELGYPQASYEAAPVSLQIVPGAPGQRATARISPQVQFRQHMRHPPARGAAVDLEEWWDATITLQPGEGTVDRLEGLASAVVRYRSSWGADRVNSYPNERWHALRQGDGSFRLTMPGISDGVPFTLQPR